MKQTPAWDSPRLDWSGGRRACSMQDLSMTMTLVHDPIARYVLTCRATQTGGLRFSKRQLINLRRTLPISNVPSSGDPEFQHELESTEAES